MYLIGVQCVLRFFYCLLLKTKFFHHYSYLYNFQCFKENKILTERKFSELCSIVGVKELCCLDPDRKLIEKAFRRNALKCHPDKGGDPVVFKKLNDAYLKLIGHITKVSIPMF